MLPLAPEEDEGCTNPIDCVGKAIGGIKDAIGGIGDSLGFWADPWGNSFNAFRDAAKGLADVMIPKLTELSLPDLTLDWFLEAYRISFALALMIVVILLIIQLVQTARGRMSGSDLGESIMLYFPMFMVGAMFGPMAGWTIVRFFHALSNSLAAWGITGSVDKTVETLSTLLDNTDIDGFIGGVVVATLLMFCMMIALFFVVLVLIVQLVTLYLIGVVIPLGIAWIVYLKKREFGFKLVGVWIGILAAHPLLFFLLGVAFSMVANSVGVFGDDTEVKQFINLVVAVLAIFMAACSPFILMKFAPVIPAATGASAAGTPSGGGGSWGPKSTQDAAPPSTSPPSSPSSSSSSGDGSPGSSKAKVASDSGPSEAADSAGGLDKAASVGAGKAGAGKASAATGARSGAAGGEATAAAGAGGGAAAAGGGAAAGAEGLAAAGAAESSTGVGAAIGVPTLLAAGAVAAGDAATKAAGKGADYSLAAMDEGEGTE